MSENITHLPSEVVPGKIKHHNITSHSHIKIMHLYGINQCSKTVIPESEKSEVTHYCARADL